ncbi:hypothetical protein [Streptomyces sp. NPDC059080]|uniref:hypothetical protein n=1 Tax=Streptomyces sp. NPDC059080 TaxID=3346718 RepID=UPI0036973857
MTWRDNWYADPDSSPRTRPARVLVADFDQANGPADPKAVAAKRAKLTGTAPSSGAGAAA